jgi:hypothetical protein
MLDARALTHTPLPHPQAFAEHYVASQLLAFGVYPEQPPEWDLDFARPPISARNPLWPMAHPGVDGLRVDGLPNRERFCKEALNNRASRARSLQTRANARDS